MAHVSFEAAHGVGPNVVVGVMAKGLFNKYGKGTSETRQQILTHFIGDVATRDEQEKRALITAKTRRWLERNDIKGVGEIATDHFLDVALEVSFHVVGKDRKLRRKHNLDYDDVVDGWRNVFANPDSKQDWDAFDTLTDVFGKAHDLERCLGAESYMWLPGSAGWKLLAITDGTIEKEAERA